MVWGAIKKALPGVATAAAGPVAGALVGGAINYAGAKQTATANKQSAREQMAFQERMSSSAYQRAADDLEAAGLNRILAFGNPASTPGGAYAQVPDFGAAMSQGAQTGIAGVSSAIQNQLTQQQTQTSATQAAKMLMETEGIGHQNKIKLQQSNIWQAIAPWITEGADGIKDLVNFVQQPVNWADFTDMVDRETPGVLSALGDFFINRYKNSPHGKVMTILIDKAKDGLGIGGAALQSNARYRN